MTGAADAAVCGGAARPGASAGEAGGVQKQISAHTLRHRFAINEPRRGVPVHQPQADPGHSDLSTAAVYLHVVEKEREALANGRPPMALSGGVPLLQGCSFLARAGFPGHAAVG